MDKVNAFKATISALCAALTALWGWFGWVVVAWVCFMGIDYATGSAAALRAGKWSSKAARDGIWHKVGSVVAVIVAAVLDMVIGHLLTSLPGVELPFTYSVFFCPLVVIWYFLTETGSIVENIGALGAPIPPWMAKTVDTLQDAVDEAGEKIAPEDGEKKTE
ncbi:holin family protein [Candidatus Allofournierella merdipullorum]|uniref:phage holin family protein n=1 Tax=Candidatus Allofournierella merdipullorum TaxID=2838595 RepID=UPI00374E8F6C